MGVTCVRLDASTNLKIANRYLSQVIKETINVYK
jgi:hypothetical protein